MFDKVGNCLICDWLIKEFVSIYQNLIDKYCLSLICNILLCQGHKLTAIQFLFDCVKCKPEHAIVTSYWSIQIGLLLDMLSLSTLFKEWNSLWLMYMVSITNE